MWLTARQGFIVAVAFFATWLILRKVWERFAPAALETSVVMGLYTLWRLLGKIDVTVVIDDAMRRGLNVWHFERAIGIGNERWLQQLALPYSWVVQFFNGYYAFVHVPSMIAFLVWFYFRHNEHYSPWRSTLALSTATSVFIRLFAVAPPRLMANLQFVDTAILFEQSVYGPPGTGISNQLAAVPSIHMLWAGVIGFALVKHGNKYEKGIGATHLVLTCLAVVLTANHWWIDGIIAWLVMLIWWFVWTRGIAPVAVRISGRLSARAVTKKITTVDA